MPHLPLARALALALILAAVPALATTPTTAPGTQQSGEPRDPFAVWGLPADPACAPGPSVVCTPLERLRLRALITGTATPRAMLEDDTGVGLTVRVGDVVGGLQVKAIRRDGLVLERTLRDWQGRLSRSVVIMAL